MRLTKIFQYDTSSNWPIRGFRPWRVSTNLQFGALALLILLGNAAQGQADMPPGTYVTPGMGVILRIEDCPQKSEVVCAAFVHGARKVQAARDAAHMMPPYRGKGWRYVALSDAQGNQIGWLRALGSRQVEILRCRGKNCQRTTWQRLGAIDPSMQAMPQIGQLFH